MRLVDLSLPIPRDELHYMESLDSPPRKATTMTTREWRLRAGEIPYTARVHYFDLWSMSGTYIDFPGHIVETDNGMDAACAPLDALYRSPAAVIHLDRVSGSGGVSADALRRACPALDGCKTLVINALGDRRFDEIEERSVYLDADAIEWIIGTGARLLVSDVYESATKPQAVFLKLFNAGVFTVCYPINLRKLNRPRFFLTALPLRAPGATQAPCRVIAELED